MNNKKTGTVKFFNEEKGFGFITVDVSKQDIFVHESGLVQHIAANDHVEFEEETSAKGPKAINVKKLG